jgi:putative membrane protein
MISEAVAVVGGIAVGSITGLVPGLHANLIATTTLFAAPFLPFRDTALALFIFAVSLTHVFVSIIPSIFLGCPDADTVMSILPGHKMLMQGKGIEAVRLSVIGAFLGIFAAILLSPIFYFAIPWIYLSVKNYLGYVLIAISIILILNEKKPKQIVWALFVFLLAGVFGVFVLGANMKQPLLPMLSGLFGISNLVFSIYRGKKAVPLQKEKKIVLKKKEIAKAVATGTVAGGLISLFPALGPSQAASLLSLLFGRGTEKLYLTLIGGVNSSNLIVSMIAAMTINKARNGSTAVIFQLLPAMTVSQLLIFLGAAVVVGLAAVLLTLAIARKFSKFVSKMNYSAISAGVVAFVSVLVFALSGFWGLVVLAIGTGIGIVANKTGISRGHLMGCLLVPVIFWLL